MSDSYPSRKVAAFLAREHKLLIGGEWVAPVSPGTIAVFDPATGEPLTTEAAAGAADVDQAVGAARAAFERGAWPNMSGATRARLIWRLSDLLLEHADTFAELETFDNGKPLHDTRAVDLPVASELLRYFAGWATKLNGISTSIGDPGEYQAFTLREPIGVVAQIIPWNFPLIMAVMKLAPALATGCTVVLKPAEETPLTALLLGELIAEAGFPAGVVNILTGIGEVTGAALSAHPGVDKIAFTGSTEVGRKIVQASAGNLKRVTLELGGKSPMVVLPDADIDAVIAGATTGIFFNAGQSCMAGSRLIVHAGVEAALDSNVRLAAAARQAGVPVVFTRVAYTGDGRDGGLFYRKVPELCAFLDDNPLGRFHPALCPDPGDMVVTKHYASAFFGTPLAANLTAMARDCLLITGFSTSGCVRATALDALQHGFVPYVVKEACGDRARGPHEAALFDLQAKYAEVVAESMALSLLAR